MCTTFLQASMIHDCSAMGCIHQISEGLPHQCNLYNRLQAEVKPAAHKKNE